MIVTVSGASGLTNAYRSLESATGSLLISGASRCDDTSGLPFLAASTTISTRAEPLRFTERPEDRSVLPPASHDPADEGPEDRADAEHDRARDDRVAESDGALVADRGQV